MKYAIGFLILLIGTLAYLASIHKDVYDGNKGLYAPNCYYRVRNPDPGTIFRTDQQKWPVVDKVIAQSGETIKGRSLREPTAEEWARIDARASANANMRKLYNVHE